MAGCGGLGLRNLKKLSVILSKFGASYPAPIIPGTCLLGRRYLFSSDILGLENYKRLKHEFSERIGPVKDKICTNIETYLKTSETNTVFTEDLKVMVYTAESDRELDLVVRMIHRFNLQNSDLRFSNFTFGPLVMRLLHLNSKPDLAYELYMDKALCRFFDQISSVRTLMDLLYENQRYEQVLLTMDSVRYKQIDGVRFPMDCVTLVAASCYHLNTEQALEKLITILKEVGQSSEIISHRSLCYGALLSLNQKKPEVAQEILSLVKEELPKLPVIYLNVKVLTYASLGRVEQSINLMRTIVDHDLPDHVKSRGDIFEDVLLAVKDAAAKRSTSKEVLNMLSTIEKVLRSGGHVPVGVQLTDVIDKPIVRLRKLQDGYKQRTRHNSQPEVHQTQSGRRQFNVPRGPGRHPGLLD